MIWPDASAVRAAPMPAGQKEWGQLFPIHKQVIQKECVHYAMVTRSVLNIVLMGP